MIGHYLSSALHNFRRRPLNTAIKLLALALGLACLLTAHVIGDYFRQADLQWEKSARTYVIVQETARYGGGWNPSPQLAASTPVAKYLRTDFPELEAAARLLPAGLAVRRPGRAATASSMVADPEFLSIFDLDMIAGEATLDRPGTILLGVQAALSLFGREDPLGQAVTVQISLDVAAIDVTVAGVFRDLPASSHLGAAGRMSVPALVSMSVWDDAYAAQFEFPVPRLSEQDNFQPTNWLTYVVLPQDGSLTAADLTRQLAGFADRRVPPGALPGNLDVRFRAMPVSSVSEELFNRQVAAPFGASIVTVLYLLGALTLAIGCVNFANLSAAEAITRAREIGLRKTVGATRGQVAAQMFVESAILVVVALLLVLPIIGVFVQTIASHFSLPVALPDASRFDYWAGVTAIVAGVALTAGVYPAWVLANLRPVLAMRMSGLGGGSGVVRTLLIGAQFATAGFLMSLVVVMLAQQSNLSQTALRPGEDPVVSLMLPSMPTQEAQIDRLNTARQLLLVHPAITGVTFRGGAPFAAPAVGGGRVWEYAQSLDPAASRFAGQTRRIYYDYFETIGVEIVSGRAFSRDMDDTFSVMIDTATAALMGYTPQQVIGQPLYPVAAREATVAAGQPDPREFSVIGVVEREPMELTPTGPSNFIYVLQPALGGMAMVRLSKNNVDGGLEHIRRTWEQFSPGQAVNPTFLDTYFEQAYRAFSMVTTILIVLSAIAVSIAAMGLFGIASFIVQRRLREIGIRKTLGASTSRVLGMMLWDFSRPVLIANLIAWPFAFVASRAYLNLFVTRIDLTPWPFLAALGVSLLIAWAAVGGQVWRAARVKPAAVLKYE